MPALAYAISGRVLPSICVCSRLILVMIETIGSAKEIEAFFGKLKKIKGLKVKKVTF